MPSSGYTGISYPFRISNQGGVVTSTTSKNNATHINESIKQILGTKYLERVMEAEVYSSVDTLLFEPNDESLQLVLKSRIVNDLTRLDERISIEEDDIEFIVEDSILYATLTYKIEKYQTYYSVTVKVGEVNE